jgi:hypothetical protein
MSNHLHLLLKTPRPNLAMGMQAFLSAHALGSAGRRRSGHLFQDRYKAEMIDDETVRFGSAALVFSRPGGVPQGLGP